jgi:hypothetical protein
MPFKVKAKPNGERPGFRRCGRFFSCDTWTFLSEEEMKPEIRQEPMLIVVECDEIEPQDEQPESTPATFSLTDAPEDELIDAVETRGYRVLTGAQVETYEKAYADLEETASKSAAECARLADEGVRLNSALGEQHEHNKQLRARIEALEKAAAAKPEETALAEPAAAGKSK